MPYKIKGESEAEIGFGLPRHTNSSLLNYTPPNVGYQVFNTDTSEVLFWNNTAWSPIVDVNALHKSGDTMTGALNLNIPTNSESIVIDHADNDGNFLLFKRQGNYVGNIKTDSSSRLIIEKENSATISMNSDSVTITSESLGNFFDVGTTQSTTLNHIRCLEPVLSNAADNILTTKKYVDDLDNENVKLSGNQTMSSFLTVNGGITINGGLVVGSPSELQGGIQTDDITTYSESEISVFAPFRYTASAVLSATNERDLVPKSYVDGLDDENVKISGSQTIAGQKTLTSNTIFEANVITNVLAARTNDYVYAPNRIRYAAAATAGIVNDNELVPRIYVNNAIDGTVKLTGNQPNIAGVKTFINKTIHDDGIGTASISVGNNSTFVNVVDPLRYDTTTAASSLIDRDLIHKGYVDDNFISTTDTSTQELKSSLIIDVASGNPALVFERDGVDSTAIFATANYSIFRRYDSAGAQTNQFFMRDGSTEFFEPVIGVDDTHTASFTTKGYVVDNYLPLTGGTISGNLNIEKDTPELYLNATGSSHAQIQFDIDGGQAGFIYADHANSNILRLQKRSATGNVDNELQVRSDYTLSKLKMRVAAGNETIASDVDNTLTTKDYVDNNFISTDGGNIDGTLSLDGPLTIISDTPSLQITSTGTSSPLINFRAGSDVLSQIYNVISADRLFIGKLDNTASGGTQANSLNIRGDRTDFQRKIVAPELDIGFSSALRGYTTCHATLDVRDDIVNGGAQEVTFGDHIRINAQSGTVGGRLVLREASNNGAGSFGLQAPDSVHGNLIYKLPSAGPTVGQVLTVTDDSVTDTYETSWTDVLPLTGGKLTNDLEIEVATGEPNLILTSLNNDNCFIAMRESGNNTKASMGFINQGTSAGNRLVFRHLHSSGSNEFDLRETFSNSSRAIRVNLDPVHDNDLTRKYYVDQQFENVVDVSPSTATSSRLRIREGSTNGTGFTDIAAADNITESYALFMPPNRGTVGQKLEIDTVDNGGFDLNLKWADPVSTHTHSAADITSGTFSGTYIIDNGSNSGETLELKVDVNETSELGFSVGSTVAPQGTVEVESDNMLLNFKTTDGGQLINRASMKMSSAGVEFEVENQPHTTMEQTGSTNRLVVNNPNVSGASNSEIELRTNDGTNDHYLITRVPADQNESYIMVMPKDKPLAGQVLRALSVVGVTVNMEWYTP